MPEPTAVDHVLELASLLNRDVQLSFERDGLTQARAHLLWVLRGGPVTQRALADALAVTPRNITGLVDGLMTTAKGPLTITALAFWVDEPRQFGTHARPLIVA